LLEKLAKLEMPVNAFNWLVDFFSGHSHSDLRAAAERRIRRKKCSVSHQPPNLVKYSASEIISAKFRRTASL